jgi:hypothetical protein
MSPIDERLKSLNIVLPDVMPPVVDGYVPAGDYLGGRAARRFAGTPFRCVVTGFLVSAASNNC